uniref:Lipoprotein n=1 Tax=OCS116 cluster bacterium TaxID=2030921 RepID=A0A2A4YZT8_9PROT
MRKIITICLSLFLLASCGTDEPKNLKHFTSPFGGKYAIRLPDQVQLTENSFIYEVKIENVENDYFEVKRFALERMNFHPFTPIFAQYQLEFLHFEYFTIPQKQRQKVYDYLADWDVKITNNPTLFKVTNQLIFAVCQKQKINDDKLVTTIFNRLNENDAFVKIYDDLEPFDNLTIPIIAYQKIC